MEELNDRKRFFAFFFSFLYFFVITFGGGSFSRGWVLFWGILGLICV